MWFLKTNSIKENQMIRLKANCGCGWVWSNYEVSDTMVQSVPVEQVTPELSQPGMVLKKAEEHQTATGHVLEIRGEIR
jgi:hypothetical protein